MQAELSSKINTDFMTEILQNVSIEGTYLNIIKAIYDKLQQTLFSMVKIESLSAKIKNKTRVSTVTIII